MTDIPKIVRERLQVVSPPANHPDADVLTAFSERSLTEREQAVVLDHLSRCGDCREIVALALPAQEPVPSVALKSSKGMFAWPTFRWGFVAAGLAAVALVGVFQYQRHAQSAMMADRGSVVVPSTEAKSETQPAVAAPSPVPVLRDEKGGKNLNSVAPPAPVRTYDRLEQFAKLSKPPRLDTTVTPSTSDMAKSMGGPLSRGTGALPHGPRQTNQWQQLNANNATLANSAAPSTPSVSAPPAAKQQVVALPAASPSEARVGQSSEMVEVQAQSSAPVADSSQAVDGLVVKNELPQPSESGQAETKVDRAKPAMGGAAGEKTLAGDNVPQFHGQAMKAALAAGPRWSISSSGNLQRSFDQGASWQDVNVNNSHGYAAASSLEVTAARAKTKDLAEADKKGQPKQPVFRTVVANGTEVWAGGASGLLYHSSDAGLHWNLVAPSAAGVALTGDILNMEFPDTQHGRISTSTGETWTTVDGGQTWQKQ